MHGRESREMRQQTPAGGRHKTEERLRRERQSKASRPGSDRRDGVGAWQRSASSSVILRAAVDLAKALGNPVRLRLLAMLEGGELCACQLAAAAGLAPSTISGHLSELRRAGLIEEDKRGRWVYSRLTAGTAPAALAGQLLTLAGEDSQIEADRRLVADLRRHSPEELCRAGGDLVALGVCEPRA